MEHALKRGVGVVRRLSDAHQGARTEGLGRHPRCHAVRLGLRDQRHGVRQAGRGPQAQLFAKGLLKPGDTFVHESFIGSQFVGTIEAVTEVAGKAAIIPGIQGWARVFGANQITVDDNDPYAYGFQVI